MISDESLSASSSTVGQRLLIDFKRLLNKCMEMVHHSNEDYRWRLEAYLISLEEKLGELRRMDILKSDQDELAEYIRNVKFLKGLVDLDKLKSSSQKLLACQILSPVPSTATTESTCKTREIGIKSKAKYIEEVRDELLNGNHEPSDSLRHRFGAGKKMKESKAGENDSRLLGETLLIQAEAAADMLDFTKDLKEFAIKSSQVIRKDVETIESTTNVADVNSSVLKKSSDRLSEFVRRSCQLWIWIMLALTAFIFLWMVVFMKIFRKKYISADYNVSE
ncbi:vesicle transport protein USE1 [Tetranychus urticae]|uniref:vesicle transport protein USE1 n=1 Tax=Tetranychus urticae TaxID=32264 RepID=UPI00077BD38E|nr:vesicle transport protein USE1 [Tetranychus urticae]